MSIKIATFMNSIYQIVDLLLEQKFVLHTYSSSLIMSLFDISRRFKSSVTIDVLTLLYTVRNFQPIIAKALNFCIRESPDHIEYWIALTMSLSSDSPEFTRYHYGAFRSLVSFLVDNDLINLHSEKFLELLKVMKIRASLIEWNRFLTYIV